MMLEFWVMETILAKFSCVLAMVLCSNICESFGVPGLNLQLCALMLHSRSYSRVTSMSKSVAFHEFRSIF